MKSYLKLSSFSLCFVLALSLMNTGCAAFRAKTFDVDVREKQHMDQRFDYTDLRSLTESLATEIVSSGFMAKEEEPPLFMIAGLQNRTSDYVDMKNISDRFRTLLFKTGEVRFINETRRGDLLKEQGYQAAHATPETQIAVGRQLGAKYMLSGSLTEMKQRNPRQVRVTTQKINYYKLTLEVTNLETSELVWTTERDFARRLSEPLIGW